VPRDDLGVGTTGDVAVVLFEVERPPRRVHSIHQCVEERGFPGACLADGQNMFAECGGVKLEWAAGADNLPEDETGCGVRWWVERVLELVCCSEVDGGDESALERVVVSCGSGSDERGDVRVVE